MPTFEPSLKKQLIKIAITGPESTGKSTLAQLLAKEYKTVYNPEYAREYIDKLIIPYSYQDVEKIAIEQLQREKTLEQKANKILFADTELIVIKIWMEHAYGKTPDWLEDAMLKQNYDLYLLCDIDIPWEADQQREHPHLRKYFFEKYKSALQCYGFPYIIINGGMANRIENCIKHISKLL